MVLVLARWVVVVSGGWVVVGAGAVVVVVDVEEDDDEDDEVDVDSVVSVTPNEVADAPGDDRPNRNTPTMRATTPALSAPKAARRGAEGRVTAATLDRPVLTLGSLPARCDPSAATESALVLRTGIGGATTDCPPQQHCPVGRTDAAAMARVLQIAHM